MAEAVALALLSAFTIQATATAVAITTVIVSVGLTVGVSLLANAFLAPGGRSGAGGGTPPADRQFVSKVPIGPRFRSYGRVRVSGQQVFMAAAEGTLYRVLAHNEGRIDGVEEHLIDETVVIVGSDGWVTAPAKYQGRVRVLWREGTDDHAHYAELTSAVPEWDATHKGFGVAHSLTLFKQVGQAEFFDTYPSGENTVYKQTLRGVRVWDPRAPSQSADSPATWTWSDNAALVILDYLRHESGLGMPMTWLAPEIEQWKAAADACDEAVPLSAGGTERRYRLWGTYSYDERPAEVLARMLTACNGRLWIGSNGGMALHVGVWIAPTVTIGDDAIVSYKIGSGNEAPETANTLTAVYTDPDQGYVEVEAEPWVDDAAVLAFGEQRSDARLYMVPSHGQCRRLMKQAFGRLAPEWKGVVTTNLSGLSALSERYIRVVISETELDFTAEIDDVQFRVEHGSVVVGLTIAFTAVHASQFDFAIDEEGVASEVPPALQGSVIAPPENFGVVIEPRGMFAVGIATWSAPTIATIRTRVEFRDASGSADWTSVESPEGAVRLETSVLTDGATYEFRARHVGFLRSSEWTSSVERHVVVDPSAPGVPTGLSTTKVGTSVTIAWTNPNSANTYGARIYRHTTADAAAATLIAVSYGGASAALNHRDESIDDGVYWWWVAGINSSGVASARAYAGTETIP